ncbi:hypothetical protein KAX02_13655 [candidate division WOR-3 bacterium]|nr:hypothetical protein [candidate division WOR-3 bacterium]
MDATTFLDNQGEASPLDLTGLSPEEIRGVSASRIGRGQMMERMINLLVGQRGREATIAGREAATRLSEERLRQEKAGAEEMTIVGPDDKPYQIQRKDLTESLKYIDLAKYRAKQGELMDEQLKALRERIPMKVKDAAGKEETYQVPTAQFPAVAKAIQERKEAEIRTKLLEKYEKVSLSKLGDMNIADFATLGGTGGVAALANRIALAGDTVGLSDAHYRHYTNLHVTLTDNILKLRSPDEALINTVNDLGRKLHTSHMMLRVPVTGAAIGRLWGETEAVTVTLPPNVTADMVYAEAEKQGRDVSEILQDIYDVSQERR